MAPLLQFLVLRGHKDSGWSGVDGRLSGSASQSGEKADSGATTRESNAKSRMPCLQRSTGRWAGALLRGTTGERKGPLREITGE